MSLKIETIPTPKPIVREFENGSKVKFRFTCKEDHFQIETKLYSGTNQLTPCKWPATLKGISNNITLKELSDAEEFLNKAKFDVSWELNHPIIQASSVNEEINSTKSSEKENDDLPDLIDTQNDRGPIKLLNSEEQYQTPKEILPELERGKKLKQEGKIDAPLITNFSRSEIAKLVL